MSELAHIRAFVFDVRMTEGIEFLSNQRLDELHGINAKLLGLCDHRSLDPAVNTQGGYGWLKAGTEGTDRAYRLSKEMPHVNLVDFKHALMLHPSFQLGGFAERLFRLRTTWRRAVYGRGPKGDA